jgi:hypothetical protein
MTKHEFKRWLTRLHHPHIVEFEQLFIGNHPDPNEIRSFFLRRRTSKTIDLWRIPSAPSAARLLDEDLTSTYDEPLWHAVHGALFRDGHSCPPQHLDRLFWTCHVPEFVLARTHVALAINSLSHSDLHYMEPGSHPECYIETLSPQIRKVFCDWRIQGWEDVQWSLPLDVSHLQKTIEPGLLKAIKEDDIASFSILKTFTRKKRITLFKIALANHAWKILADGVEYFREPKAGLSFRSILFATCSHPVNQQASVLIHQLEKGSPGIVRQTFDAGGNDPLWYTLYSGLHGPRGQVRWKPLPKELIDTLIAYGCDPVRRNRNGISFQAMNAELVSGRDIKVTPREP